MTVTENQVAKLMEEDMGSAMQYLQGKGLCLMPISLATAISTATCHTRNPLIHNNNNAVMASNSGEGPSSPSMSVLTVQSATMGNGGVEGSVKDATSVSKPWMRSDVVTLLALVFTFLGDKWTHVVTWDSPPRPCSLEVYENKASTTTPYLRRLWVKLTHTVTRSHQQCRWCWSPKNHFLLVKEILGFLYFNSSLIFSCCFFMVF